MSKLCAKIWRNLEYLIWGLYLYPLVDSLKVITSRAEIGSVEWWSMVAGAWVAWLLVLVLNLAVLLPLAEATGEKSGTFLAFLSMKAVPDAIVLLRVSTPASGSMMRWGELFKWVREFVGLGSLCGVRRSVTGWSDLFAGLGPYSHYPLSCSLLE